MHLIVTKKHRAHLFISFNKTHSASRFSQFYAKQKINLAWPYLLLLVPFCFLIFYCLDKAQNIFTFYRAINLSSTMICR